MLLSHYAKIAVDLEMVFHPSSTVDVYFVITALSIVR